MKNGKKLLFGMLCVAMIFFGWMIPTSPPAGAAPAAWSDDFESYATGTFPSSGGWVLHYSGLGSSYQYVDNSHSVSGTKSLHLVGSSCWSATAYHALDLPSQVSFEAMVFIDAIVNCGCENTIADIALYDPNLGTWGTAYGFVLFSCDGKIYAGRSNPNREYDVVLGSYQPRQWYHVQVNIDLVSRLFDVYINGTLCGSKVQIMDGGTPKGIEVISCHGGNPTAWFDDVKVSAGPSVTPTPTFTPAPISTTTQVPTPTLTLAPASTNTPAPTSTAQPAGILAESGFPLYIIGAAVGGIVVVGTFSGYLWRRRREAIEMKQYRQELEQWEKWGYDISDFKNKWFK